MTNDVQTFYFQSSATSIAASGLDAVLLLALQTVIYGGVLWLIQFVRQSPVPRVRIALTVALMVSSAAVGRYLLLATLIKWWGVIAIEGIISIIVVMLVMRFSFWLSCVTYAVCLVLECVAWLAYVLICIWAS